MSDTEDQTTESNEPVVTEAGDSGPSAEERQWGMIAHLSALVGFVIPFGTVIGPLVVWQMKKADMPFVDDQGKEALNFQITVAIALFVSFLLAFILIGFLLLPIVGIGAIVFTVIAGIKANEGETYRYPVAWRIIT
jgi:uncharacterized Tic20 family protein